VHEEAAYDPQRPNAGSRCLEVSSYPNPLTFKTVAVLREPREGPLYHPSARKYSKASWRHQPLPVHPYALLGPLLCPGLCHLLGERLLGLTHHLYAHAHDLLGPPRACPSLGNRHRPTGAKGVEDDRALTSSSSLMPSWSGTLALWTRTFITSPSVSTKRWRLGCPQPALPGLQAALSTSHPRGLHGLGVHDARAGIRIPAQPRS
jgi:hypothetical protein